MGNVPNHLTLDNNYPEFPWQFDADEEEDTRLSFSFIDGSRIILPEFDDPIVELPRNKPYLTVSCAQIAAEKINNEEMSDSEAIKYITNLYQYNGNK